eukprot:253178_1
MNLLDAGDGALSMYSDVMTRIVTTRCARKTMSSLMELNMSANSMTCDSEQRLAVSDSNKFVPRCQPDDPTLYDGGQCQLHDEVCYCVDQQGDMIKIIDDWTWQQTMR